MRLIKYVNGKQMIENKKNILDQYFTKKKIAERLYKRSREIISSYVSLDKYFWLEPSVGEGCFLDLLPPEKRIGIDVNPKRKDVIKSDYLKYKLPNKPIIVIGNPPFGHRGVLALEFIKHSIKADFICFILPMFFESKGKGSIKYRVRNFNLIHSEQLEKNAFYIPNGGVINVNCVFQIWSKKYTIKDEYDFSWYFLKKTNPFKKYLSIYTVSLAKKRECGKKWIFHQKADFYLSTTFYKTNRVVYKFSDVKYGSGIAIKINTQKPESIAKIKKLFKTTNWNNYSNLATNSCRHITKANIYDLMKDNGFKIDETIFTNS